MMFQIYDSSTICSTVFSGYGKRKQRQCSALLVLRERNSRVPGALPLERVNNEENVSMPMFLVV